MDQSFLPQLSPGDVQRAAQLIQQAYAPQNHLSPEDQRRLQQELLEIQKRPEAWGLVIPFLEHSDPNVQFFGAHTASVKIVRDWGSIAQEHALQLRDLILNLTAHSIAVGRSKVILRKLFVAIVGLALRLAPTELSQWPDWLTSTVTILSNMGVPPENLLDFLSIAAEEVNSADLLPPNKTRMQRSLQDAVGMVTQAITACLSLPAGQRSVQQALSALKCLEAWAETFPSSNLAPIIPLLIDLLNPTATSPLEFEGALFEASCDALEQVMSHSAFYNGGWRTLAEPLLIWIDQYGSRIVENTLQSGAVDEISHTFCKLLIALGENADLYLSNNIVATAKADPTPSSLPVPDPIPSRGHIVQTFLRLLLAYTALPGYYGADEEESEMTLGFWYLYQEALWNADYGQDEGDPSGTSDFKGEENPWAAAKAVYFELVQVLRRKVTWPPQHILKAWPQDQRDKFQAYRRDVADTLVNAYYVLRDDLLAYYVNSISELLSRPQEQQTREEVEALLHCTMAVQEAVPLEDNAHLRRLFGSEILGHLPTTGHERVRRTALLLIGSYSSWFTTQPSEPPGSTNPSLLMNAISYVAAALNEPNLCLPAANTLRDICDTNRAALAPHIAAFGQLHANLGGIPDAEKSKVLQSISSVIQALPPPDQIPPVEAIMNPVVTKLLEALQSSGQLPEEARVVAIQQIQTLSGAARGLTRTSDSLLIFDDSPLVQSEVRQLEGARNDSRMVELREAILRSLRGCVDLWSTDASVSDALSDLFKAITALPSDETLLTLPPGPLLELVCAAAQRQLTAVWLSLATMLIVQLDPPAMIPTTFRSTPTVEAEGIVLSALTVLLQISFTYLGQPGAMEANPDIVQAFFSCMETVAQHFVATFYRLPSDLFNALMRCALSALRLQERYSLVSACTFLAVLINRTANVDELSGAKATLAQAHGKVMMKAILEGFAGVAPRSVSPNLVELLSTLLSKYPTESKAWISETLYADDFAPSKATKEAKDKFVKTIFGSRVPRRTRDAANQFTLVARGLEGSSFGHSSISV